MTPKQIDCKHCSNAACYGPNGRCQLLPAVENNPGRTTFLTTFAPYLPAGIEVESPAFGRGLLVGLPYSTRWERPFADVRFEGRTALSWLSYDLSNIKPVLYDARDAAAVVAALPSIQRTGGHFGLTIHDAEQLHRLARIVDTARALGIALNLPEGSYVRRQVAKRKEVARG